MDAVVDASKTNEGDTTQHTTHKSRATTTATADVKFRMEVLCFSLGISKFSSLDIGMVRISVHSWTTDTKAGTI